MNHDPGQTPLDYARRGTPDWPRDHESTGHAGDLAFSIGAFMGAIPVSVLGAIVNLSSAATATKWAWVVGFHSAGLGALFLTIPRFRRGGFASGLFAGIATSALLIGIALAVVEYR